MPGYSDIEQKEMDTREKLDANRTADRTCPDVDGTASNDTREKLEADVLRLFGYRDEVTTIKEWLDRQAAITEREVFGENKLSVNCDACLFKKRVDALTAERGYWYNETRNTFDAVDRTHPFGLNIAAMDYPPREGVTNPATLVIGYMDGLRDRCAELESKCAELEADVPCKPEGDAVAIMRECAASEHGMAKLRDRLGVECVAGWQMRCLGRLADMVERGYVRTPLDRDGEPLHINDAVYGEDGIRWIVTGFRWGSGHCVSAVDEKGRTRDLKPSWLTHEAPREIVDVLADFAAEVEQGRNTIDTARRYAEELRGMMGGDAQ